MIYLGSISYLTSPLRLKVELQIKRSLLSVFQYSLKLPAHVESSAWSHKIFLGWAFLYAQAHLPIWAQDLSCLVCVYWTIAFLLLFFFLECINSQELYVRSAFGVVASLWPNPLSCWFSDYLTFVVVDRTRVMSSKVSTHWTRNQKSPKNAIEPMIIYEELLGKVLSPTCLPHLNIQPPLDP